ncbi:MAG: hypothetical protein IT433_10430 [Phycisphaerales bacterium]|nr:hypothetical protein [Phycisphaerales bacterium]
MMICTRRHARWAMWAIFAVGAAGSVKGQPSVFTDLGSLSSAETRVLPIHLNTGDEMRWFRCTIDGAGEAGFLDLWTIPSCYCGGFVRLPRVGVYDSSGTRVRVSDLVTERTEAMLTFGAGDPRPPLTVIPPPEGFDPEAAPPFDGRDGVLPPGEYWFVFGSGLAAFGPSNWLVTNGTPPNDPERDTVLYIRIQPPDIPYCDGDFNWDGNTDQDDVLYLANVLAGGENPTGRWADYNRDGNEDQDDLLALVHTIAGGGCPE